jgi:hypothetical protein
MVTGGCKTVLILWSKVEMVKWNRGRNQKENCDEKFEAVRHYKIGCIQIIFTNVSIQRLSK